MYPYSLDNKRYHTYNYYLRNRYGKKVSKVIIDAGFTCPNRDGTKGTGGCTFCSLKGSGDTNENLKKSVMDQYLLNRGATSKKWTDVKYIPYFQSFSNTYGPLEKIKTMIEPFLEMEEVAEIAIATRCDCLQEECIEYLDSICDVKPVTVELGLQTTNDLTGKRINRCHTFRELKDILFRLERTKIRVTLHVMNGLPGESEEDMIKTVNDLSDLPFDGIKIHMLHVLKNTVMGDEYIRSPFSIISREDYIRIIVRQLELLNPHVVVERLTGDPIRNDLIAPLWVSNKKTILNDIDKMMKTLDTCQGKLHKKAVSN